MSVRIITGDCLDMLPTLPAESVQCVVTSPPYFGLRDYGTATWKGGTADCDHKHETRHQQQGAPSARNGRANVEAQRNENFRSVCGKCGATRIDRQIGLEPTPAEFVGRLVAIFEEVKRVLRKDGTCWVNLGDSYAGSGKGPTGQNGIGDQGQRQGFQQAPLQRGLLAGQKRDGQLGGTPLRGFENIPAKNLLLIPERFAIAMQEAGWYVRSRIAWCKKSAMPESVQDRPTSAWEHIWMFSKSARYFYDAEAVRSTLKQPGAQVPQGFGGHKRNGGSTYSGNAYDASQLGGANLRNFWLLSPEPLREAHYAAYPTELVRRCILAGTSEKGACASCGSPWRRSLSHPCEACGEPIAQQAKSCPACGHIREWKNGRTTRPEMIANDWSTPGRGTPRLPGGFVNTNTGKDWQPFCACPSAPPHPCVVLDPFGGAGTTGLVADRLGRDAILIELNPEYAELARRRLTNDAPMFAEVSVS